jgi:hypothetical protein
MNRIATRAKAIERVAAVATVIAIALSIAGVIGYLLPPP